MPSSDSGTKMATGVSAVRMPAAAPLRPFRRRVSFTCSGYIRKASTAAQPMGSAMGRRITQMVIRMPITTTTANQRRSIRLSLL